MQVAGKKDEPKSPTATGAHHSPSAARASPSADPPADESGGGTSAGAASLAGQPAEPRTPTPEVLEHEEWRERELRVRTSTGMASVPGWHLAAAIVKADDDLRQEVLPRSPASKAYAPALMRARRPSCAAPPVQAGSDEAAPL